MRVTTAEETRASRAAARSSLRHNVVLWILAVAAALVAVLLWLASRDGSAGANQGSGGQTQVTTTAPAPSTTTPSAATTTADQVSNPQEAVALMRLAVSDARRGREIDARAALVLNRRLDEISAALRDTRGGRGKDPSQLVNDLAKTINELADQGHITYAGQQLLAGPFADLQRQVPPPSD
jgi:hypothetical protein